MHEPVERAVGEQRDLALEQRAVRVGGRHPLLLEEPIQLLRLLRARERRRRRRRARATDRRRAASGGSSRRAARCRRRTRCRPARGSPRSSPAARRARPAGSSRRRRGRRRSRTRRDARRSAHARRLGGTRRCAARSRGRGRPTLRDRLRGQIDAERAQPGGRGDHRHQVPAGPAADLQHARVERVRRLQAVQRRDGRQAVRMGLGIRKIGVTDRRRRRSGISPAFFTPSGFMRLGSGRADRQRPAQHDARRPRRDAARAAEGRARTTRLRRRRDRLRRALA